MRTILILAVASLLLASCGSPEPDMTALRKTVEEYNAATIDGMLSGNMEKANAYYEEDALEMAPNEPIGKGKAAIKQMQDNWAKSGMKITAAKFDITELEAGGKVAYEVGTYTMSFSMAGAPMSDKGKYVAVWRQQADGSWKVRAETWNSDMPLPSMEKPKETKKSTAKKPATKSTTKSTTKKAPAKKATTKK